MRKVIGLVLVVIWIVDASAQSKQDDYHTFGSQWGFKDFSLTENACDSVETGPPTRSCAAYADRREHYEAKCAEIFTGVGFIAASRCHQHRNYCADQKTVIHVSQCFEELDDYFRSLVAGTVREDDVAKVAARLVYELGTDAALAEARERFERAGPTTFEKKRWGAILAALNHAK